MTQLTKEAFDQAIAGLVSKRDAAASEERIIKRIDEAQEELASMVKNGFDSADKNFARLTDTLEVRKDVEGLKAQMLEIRQALNLKN